MAKADIIPVGAAADLAEQEAIIESAVSQAFVTAGLAFKRIRDGKLYKASPHDTFAAYCCERWQLEHSQVYWLIDAAQVVESLSPIGEVLPKHESIARPLTRLLKSEPEAIPAVWQECIDRAPKGKEQEPIITAKHVTTIVDEYLKTTPDKFVLLAELEKWGKTLEREYDRYPEQWRRDFIRETVEFLRAKQDGSEEQ